MVQFFNTIFSDKEFQHKTSTIHITLEKDALDEVQWF
jgi:hypothetical protein